MAISYCEHCRLRVFRQIIRNLPNLHGQWHCTYNETRSRRLSSAHSAVFAAYRSGEAIKLFVASQSKFLWNGKKIYSFKYANHIVTLTSKVRNNKNGGSTKSLKSIFGRRPLFGRYLRLKMFGFILFQFNYHNATMSCWFARWICPATKLQNA